MRNFVRAALLGLLLANWGVAGAFASSSTDRVSTGKDITVSEGETASDIVCVFCNVTLHGNVRGDIVTVLGNVTVDASQFVSGDMVTVGGDVILGNDSSVQGDLVVVGGDLNQAPGAAVHGDREIFPGRAWLFLPFAPFLILLGVVWLAIWLIRRNTYRFPMYPYGRGL
jgi:hypothetical protein